MTNLPLCILLCQYTTPRLFSWVILCFHHIIHEVYFHLFYISYLIVSNALYSYPAADLTCYWRSIQQRTSEASYQYTLGYWQTDVLNFVFLDCTNCILDCTNWLDCTLRISPGSFSISYVTFILHGVE